jgi:hypothetical protein
MKGQIETTIPQRQYENIKITYYFDGVFEQKEALEQAIKDCINLYNRVQLEIKKQTIPQKTKSDLEKPRYQVELNIKEERHVRGIDYRLRDDQWEMWTGEEWVAVKEPAS